MRTPASILDNCEIAQVFISILKDIYFFGKLGKIKKRDTIFDFDRVEVVPLTQKELTSRRLKNTTSGLLITEDQPVNKVYVYQTSKRNFATIFPSYMIVTHR